MNHIVITGGASSIGESLARRLMASGEKVSVIDAAAADGCGWWADSDAASRGSWHEIDVTDAVATAAAISDAETIAPVDGLAVCAMVNAQEPVLHTDAERFALMMQVNTLGTLVPAQALSRLLVAEERPGVIVTVASTAGLGYVDGLGVADHASMSAVVGLTRSLAGDLAQHGIRVNCVAPGTIRTQAERRHEGYSGERAASGAPAGRLAEPDEVAAVIEWMLSPASSFITGHVLPVEGGQASVAVPPVGGHRVPNVDTRDARAL